MSQPGGRAAKGRSIKDVTPHPAALGEPWTTYRTLDPIRAAALQAAVALSERSATTTIDQVLYNANRFERWLTDPTTSEESDGQ